MAMIMSAPYYDADCNWVAQYLSIDQMILTRYSSVINQHWDVSIFTCPTREKKDYQVSLFWCLLLLQERQKQEQLSP